MYVTQLTLSQGKMSHLPLNLLVLVKNDLCVLYISICCKLDKRDVWKMCNHIICLSLNSNPGACVCVCVCACVCVCVCVCRCVCVCVCVCVCERERVCQGEWEWWWWRF